MLAHRRSRAGKGPAVLLLHGLGGSARIWEPLEAHLAGWDALAVDLLGHGHSPAPDIAYTLHQHVEALVDLLAAADFPRCVVVGHSMGGVLAAALAALHPRWVERLVLAAAPMPVDYATNLREVRLSDGLGWLTLGEPLSRLVMATYRLPFLRPWSYPYFPADVVDDFERAPWYAIHRSLWNTVLRQDLRPLARRLACPATVIAAGRDAMVLPTSLERYAAFSPCPVRRVEVPEADHVLPWTHPEAVAAQLSSQE